MLAEVEALVADGVAEDAARAERQCIRSRVRRSNCIRKVAAGMRSDRRTTTGALHKPAPGDFTDDVIEAMAQTPNVMPSLHMPCSRAVMPCWLECVTVTVRGVSSGSLTGYEHRFRMLRSPQTSLLDSRGDGRDFQATLDVVGTGEIL